MTTSAVPRLAPLAVREWDENTRAVFRGHLKSADRYLSAAPDAPAMPGILGILAHHTELAGAWLAYNGLLIERPSIDPRDRELVILRVAWRSDSEYEWSQHVRIARGLGLTEEQVEAVRYGPQAPQWSPVQRSLLTMADQLLDRHRVDDHTWAQLELHFDNRQLIELLFVAGSYLCLAMVLNSVALQPDPDREERS
ncbi:carboxymuconolactone decarboxylase family protein [Nocardia mangyaensis]|uniref:carboxymuconolactone decarboxylase family protein n=1 Tax=Nocardia mangyaensis TaxID=2213200 RepID=UPI002675FEAC|nr:carboxymuconolactone decarboxylase family protein [Nocardia mangyaensis]MDO3646957.1 carboxymuconolactone decarboxylase family protein [Nocardia mangyaensis]